MLFTNSYNFGIHKRKANNGLSLLGIVLTLAILNLIIIAIVVSFNIVQNSKIKSLIAEFNMWKKVFNTFYASKGRLPGDLNYDGFIGPCWGNGCGGLDTWKLSTFEAPYDIEPNSDEFHYIAPFIELYNEGLIDFQPNPQDMFMHKGMGGRCYSKTFPKGYFWFESFGNYNVHPKYYLSNIKPGTVTIIYYANLNPLKVKIAKEIDKKMDDGIYNAGSMRAQCDGKENIGFNNYDKAKTCKIITYKMI